MLRSVLAQLDYTYQINHWDSLGVPFKTHLHVPERHPDTSSIFVKGKMKAMCLRYLNLYVLMANALFVNIQRIGNSLRRGCVRNIGLERFVEALEDPKTGLTYPALTGVRKQSVEDVERLFGQGVIDFMKDKNYEEEAEYLQKIRNWRRAIDERGLKEEKRQQYITEFLDYIISDLMPWYLDGCKDFSLLEVNR